MSRIEVVSKVEDSRAEVRAKSLREAGFDVNKIELVDAYTLDAELPPEQLESVAEGLRNPVVQDAFTKSHLPGEFDWAVEIGFHPGVTDNVGHTVSEGIEARLGRKIPVGSSQVMFISGNLSEEQVCKLADGLYNPVIQRAKIKSREQYLNDKGMNTVYPRVNLHQQPTAALVDLLHVDDKELETIGKKGVANADGSRNGPLSMSLEYMKAVQAYFKEKGRNPTDVELESIAQTWSEHCKHTIFANPITMTYGLGHSERVAEGIFKKFIKGSTAQIRKRKGDKDFCVSLFSDNAGVIRFDETHNISYKVETHNSPSALDPFGGAITGIVGVNRDPMGTRKGHKCVANVYGYCLGDPRDKSKLFKGPNFTQEMLSSKRIGLGVIDGVNVGGNCSGIGTELGFAIYDQRYSGKPVVYVGTVGLEEIVSGEKEKAALPGDYIVMVGGRIGRDGIHGATFSSEAMDAGSPAGAVQIGDPITQKKMHDALIFEAKPRNLYSSITDNGAGGLSCSVAEMAKECGGCRVELDKAPTKYPGMSPWQIWISESQERMTLSVPKDKWKEFSELMQSRDVEATVIGEFNDSGKCVVDYNGKNVMDVDLDFLHDGVPERELFAERKVVKHEEPVIPAVDDLTGVLFSMLGRLNICSKEFIAQQYDHEVQGGSALKPLQGNGRVYADASAFRPVLSSKKAVVLSQGICPSYSDINTYHMAACAVDTAVRRAVCAGANLDHLALLDNFCWPGDSEANLGDLFAANMSFSDHAIAHDAPPISGKDSMFNTFKGYDENNNPVTISVPPTLLVSTISVVDDVKNLVSLDAKVAGDLVYVLGDTHDELGGSEYFKMVGEQQRGKPFVGNRCPVSNPDKNPRLYRSLQKCNEQGVVASAKSVDFGGLGVALAKTAMGGLLGMDVSIDNLPGKWSRADYALFSESQGRCVVTIDPKNRAKFEELMKGHTFAQVGTVRDDNRFVVQYNGKTVVDSDVNKTLEPYKAPLRDF